MEQQKCDQRMEKNKQDLEMKRQREKTCMNKKLEQQKKNQSLKQEDCQCKSWCSIKGMAKLAKEHGYNKPDCPQPKNDDKKKSDSGSKSSTFSKKP